MKNNEIRIEFNEESAEFKELDKKLFQYYADDFYEDRPIDPVQKIKIRNKIYRYERGRRSWRSMLKTVSVASIIGMSVFLFSRFNMERKIEENISIID